MKIRLLLSLLLCFALCFGQENKKLDSLSRIFKTFQGKEILHFAVLTYLPHLQNKNPKKSVSIVDGLLPFIKNEFENYRVALYNQKGESYEILLKDKKAINCYDEAIKTARANKGNEGVVRDLQRKVYF